jgi:hypothetical protein
MVPADTDTNRKSEHPYILETISTKAGCKHDRRGHKWNRVCLDERPYMTYWVFAISETKQKTTASPPGISFLTGTAGDAAGLTMEDVVRSSLFVRDYNLAGALENIEPHKLIELARRPTSDNTTNPDGEEQKGLLLDHYGSVPGGFALAICQDPRGSAISSIYMELSANYPCHCKGINWRDSSDTAQKGTAQFILKSKLYEVAKYGEVCRKVHGCRGNGNWATRLGLLGLSRKEQRKIPKEMREDWTSCTVAHGHGKWGSQKEGSGYS